MWKRRGGVPNYTENIEQVRLIKPEEFTGEDLVRCLGATATQRAFTRDYGEGFEALFGDRVDGEEFIVVKFLPEVRHKATNLSVPKNLPSVVTESGRWQNRSGIIQRQPVGSRLVVERVEQIAELNRGKMKGVRFAGTSGPRLATLDVWSNREAILFDQPNESRKKIPDVLSEIEQLKTGDPSQTE